MPEAVHFFVVLGECEGVAEGGGPGGYGCWGGEGRLGGRWVGCCGCGGWGRVVCFCGMERGLSEGFVRRMDRWGGSGRLEGWVWSAGWGLLCGRCVGGEGGEDGGEGGVVVHSFWVLGVVAWRIGSR